MVMEKYLTNKVTEDKIPLEQKCLSALLIKVPSFDKGNFF